MELNNLTELELYFADHFDTVLFPVLAEIYQNKGQYSRAKKVCEIGLGHHPDSIDCLLYTSPSPRDVEESRMPSSA